MTKTSKILFIIWIMLAIACFVGAFFTPVVWIKVIGLVFGGLNSLIILTWILTAIQGVVMNNKLNSDK